MYMDFSKLTTPQDDGEVLVEPQARELPSLLLANQATMRNYSFTLMGLPFQDIRRESRLNINPDVPLVVTGHQPEFIHAGVWAKHVVTARLAQAVGGSALNLIVDQDSPKADTLPVPDTSSFPNQIKRIKAFANISGSAYEHIAVPSAEVTDALISNCKSYLESHYNDSMLPVFFDAYQRKSLIESMEQNQPGDWVDLMIQARNAVDKILNIEITNERISNLSMLPLLGEIIFHKEKFVSAYNRALVEYRKQHRVKNAARPLPNLYTKTDLHEIPFWAYKPNQPRRRLFVKTSSTTLSLLAGEEPISETDKQDLSDWDKTQSLLTDIYPWVIRPRALILTLWARLFLSDLFIHGIGGAKYDRITDNLIRNYFNINPPAMACVSATLYMNFLQYPKAQTQLKIARHQLRDIRFNPQRYIQSDVASELIAQKEIAAAHALELKRNKPDKHGDRKQVFDKIKTINQELLAKATHEQQRISDHVQVLTGQSIQHHNAVKRDYFFAMLPEYKLRILLRNLPDVQDFLS